MKTGMSVVIYIYLKHSPDCIDSKYEYMDLTLNVFAEIPFLAFLALHWGRKRCGQIGPSTYYSQSEVA